MPIQNNGDLFKKLEMRLKQPLPGINVQKEMSAYAGGKTGIDFNFNGIPKESSVLIVLFESGGDVFFPLIQRPLYTGVHSGQIGLPGGKVEEHDIDRIDTALRETEEEIGVKADDVKVLGKLTELYVQASHYNVMPVVGYLPYRPEYIPDPEEVSRVIDGEVGDLISSEKRKVKELLIRDKYKIMAPYFDIKNEIVWGATAMILSEFSAILKEILE
jgi:8-oxo-dGTP pyrophosphatase MutT (NUDIX family)